MSSWHTTNAQLRKWQAVAEQLGYENEVYRRLLKVDARPAGALRHRPA